MSFNIDDDEYVAKLLAHDAKKTTKTYDLVGLDAFNPTRSRAGAPKPNTNFLRHIIRQTDSHNAALLAKEAEESSSRLRQMNREMDKERTEAVDRAKRRIEGRLSPPARESDSQKRRSDQRNGTDEDKDDRRDDQRRRRRDDRSDSQSRGHKGRTSDSDPLEAIVGPLPPPPQSIVRSRGRGVLKGNSLGIESRFSTNYDPSMDMKPGSDVEDDWSEALEVMRDRERWKQQGADRLRAAGFKDNQVKKWEKGGDPMEEDVVWTKRGQGREWDRGKVVDDDGDVVLKAEWGRLK
ncbi:hypothetical protein N0V86_000746 [Didymella sp. IMI 355093]|nr:hypothetical protein N0V86_000746 [Didymella sp. IMI 355093]